MEDMRRDDKQKFNARGIDIGDFGEVGEHLGKARAFYFICPGTQVSGVLPSGETAVQPKDTDIASMLKFDEHVVIVLHWRTSVTNFKEHRPKSVPPISS